MGVEVLTAVVVALALLPLLFTARDTGSRPVLALAIAGWLAAAIGTGVATYVYREDRPVPIATAIKNRPVTPADLAATIYRHMEVPLDATYRDPRGRPRFIVEENGRPLSELF